MGYVQSKTALIAWCSICRGTGRVELVHSDKTNGQR